MIEILQQIDTPAQQQISRFLASMPPQSGVCGEHDPRWLVVLAGALGHQAIAIVDREEQNMRGYLPLLLVKTHLFGRFLVSLPYLNRAGIVAENIAARDRILLAATQLAQKHNVQYLELRQAGPPLEHDAITHSKEDKVAMILDLPGDEDKLWSTLSAKVRNQIRKGDRNELTIRWGGRELVDDFYSVFAVNMRDLGTPVYPRKLFSQILAQFPDEAELAVVACQGSPIAGALLVHDNVRGARGHGLTQVPSASCLRQFNNTNANMWMYHHLLKRAIARNSKQFDFGRSTVDSGTYRFKKQWGAAPYPTCWQYHLRYGQLDAVRPDNPKYQRRIATWRKLPVWVTRMVGPAIVRGIP